MTELADLLIDHGAIEGINLDGGGSSTMVQDNVVINYPSDRKPPSCDPGMKYHCERPVSSIFCVQEYEENPFSQYFAVSGLFSGNRILPLSLLICLSCVGGCIVSRMLFKPPSSPACTKGRALMREEGVSNLSSGEEESNSMSRNSEHCGF
mmetsp:Transcript_53668/g.100585  ORF Transcript_53668/g.100585 Transcript_53668/m.100585 type:complete len:151 (+) Transcript_53668:588-1040(+)